MNTGIEMMDIEVQCPKHGSQSVKRIKSFDGVPFFKHAPDCPVCPVCSAEAHRLREERRQEEELTARIQGLVDVSGLPVRYAATTFDDYRVSHQGQARAVEVCQRYVASIGAKARPGWLVLTGKPGTGKTMLMGCMTRALAAQMVPSRYATQSAMGREFRATYQRDADCSETAVFAKFGNTRVLLLDELGAGSTEHTDRLLFEVLDERYANRRPTVIATNHPRDHLRDVLGERLFDRLKEEATFVAFDWESARKPAGLRRDAA